MTTQTRNSSKSTWRTLSPRLVYRAEQISPAFLRVMAAFALLSLGHALPDPRTEALGLPLNTIAFGLFCLSIVATGHSRVALILAVMLAPLHLMALSLLWSENPDYGATKWINLYALTIVSATFLFSAVQLTSLRSVFRMWITLCAVLLVAAVLYRLQRGFFDRDVSFAVHGPITFARQMGIAAVMSFFALDGYRRWVSVLAFSAAVAWTASKGPLLAIVTVIMYLALFRATITVRLVTIAIIAAIVASFPFAVEPLRGEPTLARLIEVYDHIMGQGAAGSIEDRAELSRSTLEIIRENPFFGVGLGGWGTAVVLDQSVWDRLADYDYVYKYPHNMFLEVLSEVGVPLGLVSLLPFFYFLIAPRHPAAMICAFGLICQSASGDLQDGANSLTFAMIVALTWVRSRFADTASTPSARNFGEQLNSTTLAHPPTAGAP